MAKDATKVNLWADADVYVAPVGTAIPANASAPFSGSWLHVGHLDGADGFPESRDVDTGDHFGWGGFLVKTHRKNFKLTKKFSALEYNSVTRTLIWPGSSAGTIVVPKPTPILVAFETRGASGQVHRVITKNYAEVDLDGDVTPNEEDLTKYELAATIFPNAAGELFTEQGAPSISSIAISPLTAALDVSDNTIRKLTATATYSDSTTGDITSQAVWSSSDAAKATAIAGYVHPVAAGTANVSCTFGGVAATAPCVCTVTA